jgi:hypothetical protein
MQRRVQAKKAKEEAESKRVIKRSQEREFILHIKN